VKQYRDVSRPYQRASLDESGKAGQLYLLIAHEGKRYVKVLLFFPQDARFVKQIREKNKYFIKAASFHPDGTILMVESPENFIELLNDRGSPFIPEARTEIQGLPLKYTAAPKFVFLNESAGESGEHKEEERVDEFADLYEKMDIVDLSAHERTYLKRFEQLGVWRKKFNKQ